MVFQAATCIEIEVGGNVLPFVPPPLLESVGSIAFENLEVSLGPPQTSPISTRIERFAGLTPEDLGGRAIAQHSMNGDNAASRGASVPLYAMIDARRKSVLQVMVRQGAVLKCFDRGRAMDVDVSKYLGNVVALVMSWTPACLGVAVYCGGAHDPVTHVTFGQRQAERIVQFIQPGDIAQSAADALAATTAWVVGLAIFQRAETAHGLAKNIKELYMTQARELGLQHAGVGPAGLAFQHEHIDEGRFALWKQHLSPHADVCDGWIFPVFLSRVPSHALGQSAIDAFAFAKAGEIDAAAGVVGDPWLPQSAANSDDAVARGYYHAAAGHYLVDTRSRDDAMRLKEAVERAETLQDRALLPAAPVRPLVALVSATVALQEGPVKGVAATAAAAFQRDVVVLRDISAAPIVSLWMEGAKLGADLATLVEIGASTNGEVVSRLLGDETSQFEVEVLADLARNGYRGEFVSTRNTSGEAQRTPDIVVPASSSVRRSVFIECSVKDQNTEAAIAAKSLAEQMMNTLRAQARKRGESLWVQLRVEEGAEKAELLRAYGHLKELIRETEGSGECSGPGWGLSVARLGNWRTASRLRGLLGMAGNAAYTLLDCGRMDEWVDRDLVFRPVMVTAVFPSERRLSKSLEATLRNKAKWVSKGGQMPDGESAIVAIGIGYERPDRVADLARSAGRILANYRACAGLAIYWSEIELDGWIGRKRRWCVQFMRSPHASVPLPDEFLLRSGLIRVAKVESSAEGSGAMRDR